MPAPKRNPRKNSSFSLYPGFSAKHCYNPWKSCKNRHISTAYRHIFPDVCKEAGLPEPEYAFMTNFVSLTIRFKNPLAPYLTDQGNGSSNETLNETLNPVVFSTYKLIKDTPGIQRKDLMARSGRVAATISRHIAILMEKDLIERRGSKRTGGYYAK